MSDWQEVKLRECISTLKGFAFKSKWYQPDGVPIVRVSDFTDNSISVDDIEYIPHDLAQEHSRYLLKTKDVIVQTVGSWQHNPASIVGKVVNVPFNLNGALLNQNAVKIIPNKTIDNEFLYYRLKDEHFKLHNLGCAQGAANQASITLSSIGSFRFNLPPLPTQKKIAKILSNYDDLIEKNLKRIKLLEEFARLTYEEWFLRFRIDGKKPDIDAATGLPFGWEKVKVNSLVSYYIGGGWGEESISDDFSDEAYVIRGTDIDNMPYGKLEGAPLRYHKTSNLASRKLQNKDIVFEVSGGSKTEGVAKTLLITDNLLEQFNSDVMCASFCKLVRPNEQHLGNMLHLSFKYLRRSKATEVFEIKSASSIINYNWEAFIKHQDLIMPSNDILLSFDKRADALINEIYNLGHQNQLLKEARDILLPRLMTGMIDTDELDIAV